MTTSDNGKDVIELNFFDPCNAKYFMDSNLT